MRPGTVSGAVATAAAAGILVRLAVWQWERGASRDSLLSYTYAVQWALLAVALVAAVVVRRRRPRRPDDAASRDTAGRVIGPPLRPGEQVADPVSVQLRRRFTRR